MKVALVDYDAGNLKSLANAVVRAGGVPAIVRTADEVASADRLILPGVGAAGLALERLRERSIDEALYRSVMERGVPCLGICLGLQLMAEKLTEFGEHAGLGWVEGEVVHIRELDPRVRRVPHTGWTQVETEEAWQGPFGRMSGPPYFYFSHSYGLRTEEDGIVVARTADATSVISAIVRGNIAATQFHPEISQKAGRRLLASFLAWSP